MNRTWMLLPVCALLLGASRPERPTPNVPAGAECPMGPQCPEGASEGPSGPALETMGDDAPTRDFIRAVDWDLLGGVVVQEGGRKKPLEAFARETLWRIQNAQTYRGQPPAFTLLSMGFDPDWDRVRLLKLGHPDLVKAFGRKRVSLEDLGTPVFLELWNSIDRAKGGKSPRDRAIAAVDMRGSYLRDVLPALRVLPSPKGADAPWNAMDRTETASANPAAFQAFVGMGRAYLSRDAAAFNTAAADWVAACKAAAPADYEALSGKIGLELLYYRVQPFRWACAGYFLAFLGYLGAWVFSRGGLKRGALGLLVASFLLHGAGIAARVVITGRPPVSNMFEVVLYVSWAVVAASFAVEAVMRLGVTWLPASGMAALGLTTPALFPFIEGVLNTPMPLDPHISQVQAVLKSNYWLTVHVCTITTSYAILFLGFATGITYLVAARRAGTATLETLDRVAWRVNQLGFLFLTVGVMTGAWWANASWGRYWGWDPKETGSFIVWCLYGGYIHLRLFGYLQARGGAWLTVVGFFSVLFTMIGVGYFLPGLHSYA